MNFDALGITRQLDAVQAERQRRRASPDLAARVAAIKHFQQLRFAHTYADLLEDPRYRRAARFFLDELYGPQDFSERDQQLARVVPALLRLFPQRIVNVVGTLVSLHALSERLDTAMAQQLPGSELDAAGYVAAWRATGEPVERERQIALTLAIGAALDQLVHKPLVQRSLHLMRGPARLAGLAQLQEVLELGFDAFRAMHGAAEFLALIAERERRLTDALFQPDATAALKAASGLLPPLRA